MVSRTSIARWLQYLYFLRISLSLWLFLPVFCILDLSGATAKLSRGILTLDSAWQVFYAVFLIVAINMTVLVTARNTVRNGRSRFRSTPPDGLHKVLTDPAPGVVWCVLLLAHIPTFLVIAYLEAIAAYESERLYLLSLCAGLITALLFWYLVSLFYYWTYRPVVESAEQPATSQPAALIFPKYDWLFGDISNAEPPRRLVFCIDHVVRFLLRRVSYAGYAPSVEGPLWELHFLSALSLTGIFVLYLFLYPLTAPVPRARWAVYGQIVFCSLLTILFLLSIADATDKNVDPEVPSRWARPVKWTFILLALTLASLFIATLLLDAHSVRLAFAFPTLGSILVLASFILWFFSGAAFFLDRYRLPVVTSVLALIFIPKLFAPWLGGKLIKSGHPILAEVFDSDHYFSVKPLPRPLQLQTVDTPAQAMKTRAPDPDQPYIVVTASGGGIQAAEWTSQILARLEKEFANDERLKKTRPMPYTFHDHVLLASGVSGGSVGLLPFLLEYTAYDPDDSTRSVPIFPEQENLFDRMTRPSGCSSLEAVGWGLTYHDLYRLIVPVRFPTSLDDDTAPDRSRALAQAFNRNLHDRRCKTDSARLGPPALPAIRNGEEFTLADAARRLTAGTIPAFTFNTTAAETGSRFLLSNYRLDPTVTCKRDFVPAESFLQVYAANENDCEGSAHHPLRFADLPLATAVRLSATFPIVSSGTRIPPAYNPQGDHFLDGGYFDNDGTASAIEFLKSALDDPLQKNQPHKILLIEIRDDDGSVVTTDQDNIANQSNAPPWTPISQLTGIAQGLWNAGHVSIARRNRRELCILEKAYYPGLDIHHVVFTIPEGKDRLSPLSWNLTTGQLASITMRATKDPLTTDYIEKAIAWVNDAITQPQASDDEVCQAVEEPARLTPQ